MRNIRNFAAFWLLGLCNNFGYVIMISAAYDILSKYGIKNIPSDGEDVIQENNLSNGSFNLTSTGEIESEKLVEHCNTIGTGAILLADILPCFIIKLVAPLFVHKIHYVLRIHCVWLTSLLSLLIVGLADEMWLIFLGVTFASVSTGLGEISVLSMTAFYPIHAVQAFSSGTGFAGLLPALAYSSITNLGVTPQDTLLIMIFVPILQFFSYFTILVRPQELRLHLFGKSLSEETPLTLSCTDDNNQEKQEEKKTANVLSSSTKWVIAVSLQKYMIPLGIVYFAEYFINQALYELVYFENISSLTIEEQYRWYQVLYQLGVFISRSSGSCFHTRKTWIFTILQVLNIVVFMLQVFFQYIPFVWIVFLIIIYEGLLGGGAYVNTFMAVSAESSDEAREFSMGLASAADSLGVVIAGVLSIPTHNWICSL